MSTSPYSKDLRTKVIKYLESGRSQRDAAKVFNLSKSTVNNWNRRYKEEGDYGARKRLGAKPSIVKEDLIRFVESNSNLKLSQIAKEFKIGISGVHYWLKKLGYGYKKKTSRTWKRAKKSEIAT